MSNVEIHIKKIEDPQSWLEFYRQQKLIGDILLEKLTNYRTASKNQR